MKGEFKPYVPAEKSMPEITITSVVTGVLLAVVFGAAHAYLGLRVGMTVSASIPAAVMSMGIIRVLLRRNSILESTMVQTIGSAGESVAAGAIFTIPALFLWAGEGVSETPSLLSISIIAVCGAVLGVLFMIPLRNALIVKEHETLPYPEGTACAEVLLAGENGGANAASVFKGMGASAAIKLIVDGLKAASGAVTVPITALKTMFSMEVYPALIGVGYICRIKIAAYMFAGGVLGWFVLIPMIVTFGGDSVLYPAAVPISELYESGGPSAVWSSYVRYIGAGAVAAGGIISLIKSFPMIVSAFMGSVKVLKSRGSGTSRTEQSLGMITVAVLIIAVVLVLWLVPAVPITLAGALLIVVFGFFFAAVSSRMVGLVGSSNNPVSGMAIASLLVVTFLMKATGSDSTAGMVAAISIGSVVCIIAAIAGDTSQDLKTGFLLGATPRKQQIGELIGTVISAAAIGGVLLLLNSAWKFGSAELAAPQATLMKMIVEGVMQGDLPWALVFIGVFIALVFEIVGIPVLPAAIGLYLPLELSSAIMLGGVLRWIAERKAKTESETSGGLLFCSGLIAGEGVVGILLAILTVAGVSSYLDISAYVNTGAIGAVALAVIISVLILISGRRKPAE